MLSNQILYELGELMRKDAINAFEKNAWIYSIKSR